VALGKGGQPLSIMLHRIPRPGKMRALFDMSGPAT